MTICMALNRTSNQFVESYIIQIKNYERSQDSLVKGCRGQRFMRRSMGNSCDALRGRRSKASKIKSLANQAMERIDILKKKKEARCSIARSDVVQLLRLSEQDRALLRVEQVIQEQNMLDVLTKIEKYCVLLSERIELIEQEKDCPDELKEAISSIIYAASRCGEFPELQKMRSLFESRYGKDFTLRVTELRKNCGVNFSIFRKLSTKNPELESRMTALKQIADEYGISLQLKETLSTPREQQRNKEDYNRFPGKIPANIGDDLKACLEGIESMSLTMNRTKQFKNAAEAAYQASLSAAYAATAARAAVELFMSATSEPPEDTGNSVTDHRRLVSNSRNEEEPRLGLGDRIYSPEIEGYHTNHPLDYNSDSSDRDNEEIHQSEQMIKIKKTDPRSTTASIALGALEKYEQRLKFDESDDEAKTDKINSFGKKEELGKEETNRVHSPHDKSISSFRGGSRKGDDEQIPTGLPSSHRLETQKRPVSVRTRR